MMMVNTSETCATTRLIQFRYLGISINNVSRNFQQQWHPENVPDLSKGEFTAWKKVLHQVSKWCQENDEEGEWASILYRYAVCSVRT